MAIKTPMWKIKARAAKRERALREIKSRKPVVVPPDAAERADSDQSLAGVLYRRGRLTIEQYVSMTLTETANAP